MAANATAVWRVRPSGSNTNGGGYDPGIAGAGTDFSQQDSAHLSNIGTTSTSTVTLTDTGASFTSVLIGNGIYVSGTGITTTLTFITAVPTSTTLTLQTSPGTTGTTVTYHIGGGWADFWHNVDTTGNFASSSFVVPGNIIYILGSGAPNPASYTFDYTGTNYFTPPSGDQSTGGYIVFAGDPATPSSGVPCIQAPGLLIYRPKGCLIKNLWFVGGGTSNGALGVIGTNGADITSVCQNLVLDQAGYDIGFDNTTACAVAWVNGEVFSSVAKRTTNANYGLCLANNYSGNGVGVNVHDCIGPGVYIGIGATITNSIIAKNGGVGLTVATGAPNNSYRCLVANNTIDGNTGNGIEVTTQLGLSQLTCFNNVISNHTGGGAYGITVDAGTTVQNDRVKGFVNYNTFYNNTANYNAISAGAQDTALGSNPYVAQSTENYTLA